MVAHRFRDHVERLHRERNGNHSNGSGDPDLDDPELRAAWRSLQLHWLAAYPDYREEIRQRVSEAAKRAEKMSRKIDREHEDVDYLGKEVEGCG